MTNLLKKPRNF